MAILLIWIRSWTPVGTDHGRYHNGIFTCTHVVDGDTLDIDCPDGDGRSYTRIRLWGVDTPESSKSDHGTMYFGEQAFAFTRERVQGKPVRVVLAPAQTREKYDRLLAYVYPLDSTVMLNEELIKKGFAYADRRFEHAWRERFESIEKEARNAAVGLWAHVMIEQMPPWRQRYESWATSRGS